MPSTNWPGRYSRAYVVHETRARSIELDGKIVTIHGGTVEVKDLLNMIAKIRMPGQRGEGGQVRETHLTAEAIYDRTLSAQVRRLGNRRLQWFHALALASIFASHPAAAPSAESPVVGAPATGNTAPQSGPSSTSTSPVISFR